MIGVNVVSLVDGRAYLLNVHLVLYNLLQNVAFDNRDLDFIENVFFFLWDNMWILLLRLFVAVSSYKNVIWVS